MKGNDMWDNKNLINILKGNGIAVMPTDTLYGIVGRAQNSAVVNRIYEVRKRAPDKPCIILIGDLSELEKFSIILTEEQKSVIKEYWPFDNAQDLRPEPVSIVLDCTDEALSYLHRGTNTLAFRFPANRGLQNLLKETGPLVAPSANLEGMPPSENVAEAKKYFGDMVDLYADGGIIRGKASKVIKLHKDGSVIMLRK